MTRHANPRFYVGPNTNEIVLPVNRTLGVELGDIVTELEIRFVKRSAVSPVESIWSSYAVSNGLAKFQVPPEFKSDPDDFPKGFYDGVVSWGDCDIGQVELVKAPSHYLKPGRSVEDKCHTPDPWVEPPCEDGEEACVHHIPLKDGCPQCTDEAVLSVMGTGVIEYAGLDEVTPEECPLPDGAEPEGEDPEECVMDCVSTPPESTGVQKVDIAEGYIEDDDNC